MKDPICPFVLGDRIETTGINFIGDRIAAGRRGTVVDSFYAPGYFAISWDDGEINSYWLGNDPSVRFKKINDTDWSEIMELE